jgi:hypothetical protein
MKTYTEQFKVIAISSNTNSFGLKQMVLVAKSGIGYKVHTSYFNLPELNSIVNVPVDTIDGYVTGYTFAALGYEIPERMEDAPKEVIAEIFKD